MNNLVQCFQTSYINSLEKKDLDEFSVGDSIKVGLKIIDGVNERIQDFEGVCIAIRKKGVMSNFIVRKISDDIEVERTIMFHSPVLNYVKIVRKGVVRRSKLYYLRGRQGKSARIKEKISFAKKK